MNDDVDEFYINSISNQSRCTSFEVVFWAQEGGIWRSAGRLSACIVRQKNSVAGCELGSCSRFRLNVHVSKPDSGLHERPCRERDGDHVS